VITPPAGWVETSLAELMHDSLFTDGDWIETKDQDVEGGIRLVQLADVGEGEFRDKSSRFINGETATRLNCTFLRAGDVLVARMPEPLGRACLVPDLGVQAITAVDVCVLRPDASSVDASWVMWAINSPHVRRQISSLQTGTTRRRISRKNLGTVSLFVPSLAVQRRIVAAIEEHFSRLDAAVESLQHGAAILTVLRRTLLHQAFSELWSRGKLGDISEKPQYGWSSRSSREPSDFRYLRITDMTTGQVDWASVPYCTDLPPDSTRFLLHEDDILIARSGATVGRAVRISGPERALFASYLIRLRVDDSVALPAFVEWFLRSPAYWKQVKASSSGIAQPNVNAKKLAEIEIPLPTLTEQRALVDHLEASGTILRSMMLAIRLAQKRAGGLRHSVLREAFTGNLLGGKHQQEVVA
jgi:type I restriction enzyme, S subunit